MATKVFKTGHLYSTSATSLDLTAMHNQMIPGEIALALNETDNFYKIIADNGIHAIDLGAKIGGKGDEKSIDTQIVNGDTIISSLVYLKDVTAEEAAGAGLPANVQKRFRLVNAQGENVVTSANTEAGITANTSDFIDIYKDSSIVEIYVGTEWDSVNDTTGAVDKKAIGDPIPESAQTSGHSAVTADDFKYLNYVYYAGGFSGTTSGDGKYYMTQVDLDKFMKEGQYASGVTTNPEGIVTGVVDSNQEKVVSAWTDGDSSAAGVADGEVEVLSVGADGFKVANIQTAINARHANVIKMNGYTSGLTEDVFGITSADTVMQAIKKIEDKVFSNGDGNPTAEEIAAGTNNTGILFVENSGETVILNAGTF